MSGEAGRAFPSKHSMTPAGRILSRARMLAASLMSRIREYALSPEDMSKFLLDLDEEGERVALGDIPTYVEKDFFGNAWGGACGHLGNPINHRKGAEIELDVHEVASSKFSEGEGDAAAGDKGSVRSPAASLMVRYFHGGTVCVEAALRRMRGGKGALTYKGLDMEEKDQSAASAQIVQMVADSWSSKSKGSAEGGQAGKVSDIMDMVMATSTGSKGASRQKSATGMWTRQAGRSLSFRGLALASNKFKLQEDEENEDADADDEEAMYEDPDPWVFDPNSMEKGFWDLWIAFCILYSVISIPVYIGFNVFPTTDNALYVWDWIIDGFFWLDILLSFNTGFYTDGEQLVTNRKYVTRNYLEGWFLLDFVCAFPWDLVTEGASVDPRVVRVFRIVRLFRLIRLVKLRRMIETKLEDDLGVTINMSFFRLIQMLSINLLCAHLLACGWFLVGSANVRTDDCQSGSFPELCNGWVERSGYQDASLDDRYVASLYWTVATMCAVGYGDIVAAKDNERVYAIFVMLTGAGLFGFIIGNIATLLESIDARETGRRNKMADMKNYMRERKIGRHLQTKIKHFYVYFLSRRSVFDEEAILSELPTEMRYNVVLEAFAHLIAEIDLFLNEDKEFVAGILTKLKPTYSPPHDRICREGHHGREMYFVLKGRLDILTFDLGSLPTNFSDEDSKEDEDGPLFEQRTPGSRPPASGGAVGASPLRAPSRRNMLSRITSESVMKGDHKASRRDETMPIKEKSLGVYSNGGYFGDVELLLNVTCQASVRSYDHCEMLFVSKEDLIDCLHANPSTLQRMTLSAERHLKDIALAKETLDNNLPSKRRVMLYDGALVDVDAAAFGDVANLPIHTKDDLIRTRQLRPIPTVRVPSASSSPNEETQGRSAVASNAVLDERSVGVGRTLLEEELFRASRGESLGDSSAPAFAKLYECPEERAEVEAAGNIKHEDVMRGRISALNLNVSVNVASQLRNLAQENAVHEEEDDTTIRLIDREDHRGLTQDDHDSLVAFYPIPEGMAMRDVEMTEAELFADGIIYPEGLYKQIWDVLLGLLIVYSVVMVPYRIGFNDYAIGSMRWFEFSIDMIFCVDVVITFFTAYTVVDRGEILVSAPQLIVGRYLRGWFLPDVLASVPWDELWRVANPDADTGGPLVFLRLFRLFRLVRLFKLLEFTEKLEDRFRIPPSFFRLIRLIMQVTYVAHFLACGFRWVTNSMAIEDTWVGNAAALNVNGEDNLSIYIAALYYSFATMTTVGYGDIAPSNREEQLYGIFAMLIGAVMFGFIVGSMTSLMAKLDEIGFLYKERLEVIREYIRERGLTRITANRLKKYYAGILVRRSVYNEHAILLELNENLRRDVVLHVGQTVIENISFLQSEEDSFVSCVMMYLLPEFHLPGDLIFEQGQVSNRIFFLLSGSIKMFYHVARSNGLKKEVEVRTVEDTGTIGDIAMILELQRSCSAKALEPSSVVSLSRKSLDTMAKYHPRIASILLARLIDLARTRIVEDIRAFNFALPEGAPEVANFSGRISPGVYVKASRDEHALVHSAEGNAGQDPVHADEDVLVSEIEGDMGSPQGIPLEGEGEDPPLEAPAGEEQPE